MTLNIFADELTKTSAYRDPYSQPEYGTLVEEESRNGHKIQIFRDAVARDFIAVVDGQMVGNFEQFQHRAYVNASNHVSYLIEEEVRAKALQNEMQAEFEIEEARAGVIDASQPKGGTMPSLNDPAKVYGEMLKDQIRALRVAATDKEAKFIIHREASQNLALAESAVAVDLANDPSLTNETKRKAALGAWRAGEGRALVEAADRAADAERLAKQEYELALEELKSTRAIMRFETAQMEFRTAEIENMPF